MCSLYIYIYVLKWIGQKIISNLVFRFFSIQNFYAPHVSDISVVIRQVVFEFWVSVIPGFVSVIVSEDFKDYISAVGVLFQIYIM